MQFFSVDMDDFSEKALCTKTKCELGEILKQRTMELYIILK